MITEGALSPEKLKHLDQQAWEELLERYAPRLRSDIVISLKKRGQSLEMAGDIEEYTWLAAVRNIHHFSGEEDITLYDWLKMLALNRVRQRYKQAEYRLRL